jgi:adenylate cyclase
MLRRMNVKTHPVNRHTAGFSIEVFANETKDNLKIFFTPISVLLIIIAKLAVAGLFRISHLLSFIGLTTSTKHRSATHAIRYYLPEKAAADMARQSGDPGSARDLVYGTCIASDAARFTTLAEAMAPRDLAILLDNYFAALFEPIQLHGGIVTDVVGDGIMSVWAAPQPDRALRANAVAAALDMAQAVRRFNQRRPDRPMPTRIGLHTGWIMVGNVGGKGHFAWSVVGDIPNTASRIEGLNKYLGTSILASQEVVKDLDMVLNRRVGRFQLAGRAEALDIYEIIGHKSEATPAQLQLVALFEIALDACEANQITEALGLLHRVLAEFPEDGPTRFYLKRYSSHGARTRVLE